MTGFRASGPGLWLMQPWPMNGEIMVDLSMDGWIRLTYQEMHDGWIMVINGWSMMFNDGYGSDDSTWVIFAEYIMLMMWL